MSDRSSNARGRRGEITEITEDWAAGVLPRREPGAHKWDVGGVVVVAGSPLYAGAAALCCAAAGRSGSGIVSAALPRSIAPTVVGLVPEVTIVVLPEGDSMSVALRGVDAVTDRLQRSKAMVVGPGLGTDEAATALLAALFGFAKTRAGIGFGASGGNAEVRGATSVLATGTPIVVDADALNWLATQVGWWDKVPHGALVMTPHPGEMARLIGKDVADVLADPVQIASEAARAWGQTVVLKGGRTVVATTEDGVRGVESPPSLATAGSGDVLSGSIGAFLAQGLAPGDAAALAVFVGCRAAERAAEQFGTLGVVAGDLPAAIAGVLRDLEAQGG